MSRIIEKPKSWTTLIAELQTNQSIYFSAENERSISALISGTNRGGLKEKYPTRKFTVKLVTPPGQIEQMPQMPQMQQTQVTRIA